LTRIPIAQSHMSDQSCKIPLLIAFLFFRHFEVKCWPAYQASALGWLGTLRKNVSLVQKSSRTSIERSFFAECPLVKQDWVVHACCYSKCPIAGKHLL
jgi:hypothetical protein